MQSNVQSFKVAIAKGLKYERYTYDATKIPLGEIEARLDFKIWSKRILAINCYFSKTDTEEKFVVTVYCHQEMTRFQLFNSTVDFAHCPIGEIYHLQVIKNEKSKVVLKKAEPAKRVTK